MSFLPVAPIFAAAARGRGSIGPVFALMLTLLTVQTRSVVFAAEPATEPAAADSQQDREVQPAAEGNEKRFAELAERLTNTRWKGRFNFDGREELMSDEYHIRKVSKLPQGDFWLIQARIQYGDNDVTLPLTVPIKWAGDIPVISIDNLTIPGLGTFSSYVLIDGHRYAGTWQHGDVGGHMFGTIEKAE